MCGVGVHYTDILLAMVAIVIPVVLRHPNNARKVRVVQFGDSVSNRTAEESFKRHIARSRV